MIKIFRFLSEKKPQISMITTMADITIHAFAASKPLTNISFLNRGLYFQYLIGQ